VLNVDEVDFLAFDHKTVRVAGTDLVTPWSNIHVAN
jgi:hypothetical protein